MTVDDAPTGVAPAPARRWRRRLGWSLVAVAGVCLLLVVATCRLFVWPAYDAPRQADAIVSLAGDEKRLAEASALARAGYAPVLVVSVVPGQGEPCSDSSRGVEVVCFHPDPPTTRGEAEAVARMAQQRHWHRLLLVPGFAQSTRARMLFERCTGAQLVVVPVHDTGSRFVDAILHEWGALAKAVVTPSC